MDENIYTIENILNIKKIKNKFQVLIQWKDLPLNEKSWEPIENLNEEENIGILYDYLNNLSLDYTKNKNKINLVEEVIDIIYRDKYKDYGNTNNIENDLNNIISQDEFSSTNSNNSNIKRSSKIFINNYKKIQTVYKDEYLNSELNNNLEILNHKIDYNEKKIIFKILDKNKNSKEKYDIKSDELLQASNSLNYLIDIYNFLEDNVNYNFKIVDDKLNDLKIIINNK